MNLIDQKNEKLKFIEDWKITDLSKSSKTSSSASLVLVIAYYVAIANEMAISIYQWAAGVFLITALMFRLWHTFQTKRSYWLNKFTALSTWVSLGWLVAFLSTILESQGNIKVLLITFAVITGIVSSAVYSLAISRRDFITFVVMAFIPIYYKLNDHSISPDQLYFVNIILTAFIIFLVRQQKQIEETWLEQRMINFELKKLMNLFPGGIAVLKEGLYSKTNIYFEQILKLTKTHPSASDLIQNIQDFSKIKTPGRRQWQAQIPVNQQLRTHLAMTENRDSLSGMETVVTIVDIEDYKRIEKENLIQRATLEQSAKMAALGVMSSGLAHEINNPLAIILARVQLMQMQLQATNLHPETEKMLGSLDVVDKTVKRISKIIKSLRSFARETNSDPFEKVSLAEVVEMTLSFCEAQIRSTRVHFENKIDSSLQILCRPTEVSQVLLNALNNSIYAISSLDEKWLRLEAEVIQNLVVIKITDSGRGIQESLREKVMIPFFTTKEVGSGTGLGLSLSKGIVESHGGQFYFNHENPNTQLVMTFPLASEVSKTG